MNIRSVDLQVLIPRATDVSKTQQVSDHQNTLQQQQIAEEWRHLSAQRQQQIQHTHQSENGIIRDEYNQEKGQKKDRPKQKSSAKNDAAQSETDSDDPFRGHIIDIKT